MSFVSKLLGIGGEKKNKAPTPQDAIQRLREVEEMLTKKSDFYEQNIAQQQVIAKKNGTKNKRVALQALKRKKRYEKQLQQIDGTLTTIEFQREALENSMANTEVLKVLGVAAKALKAVQFDVDKVHEVMDEVAEQQDLANEIANEISNPANFGIDYDEDELLAELEELEEKELTAKLTDTERPPVQELPSVPTAEPSLSAATRDGGDAEKLAGWAS